jgi:hypothetical protein
VPQGEQFEIARCSGSAADEDEVDQQAQDDVQDRQEQQHLPEGHPGRLADPLRPADRVCAPHRLVGTLRRECLDRVIILNEAHLRAILSEFVRYYSRQRPHRSLDLETPVATVRATTGPIRASQVLGGLHHAYERAA